jgi:hypothetical protein
MPIKAFLEMKAHEGRIVERRSVNVCRHNLQSSDSLDNHSFANPAGRLSPLDVRSQIKPGSNPFPKPTNLCKPFNMMRLQDNRCSNRHTWSK